MITDDEMWPLVRAAGLLCVVPGTQKWESALFEYGRSCAGVSSQAPIVPQAQPLWIHVDFMMPELDVEVLIDGSEGVEVAHYAEHEDDQTDQMGHDAGWWGYKFAAAGRSFGNPEYFREAQGQPKYWMPLPDAPSSDDEDADG